LYFDARAFFLHLAETDAKPEPRGALLIRAGVDRPEALQKLLEPRSGGIPILRTDVDGDAVYDIRASGLPAVSVRLGRGRLDVRAGESLEGRPVTELGKALRERFGPEAFGAGHATAMVDVAALLSELERPATVPEVPPQRLALLQGFAAAFVRQLTSIDMVFLDLAPSPTGARLRGTLTLRPR